MIELDGIFIPHITPFTRYGELDEGSLRGCVRFWVNAGVSGLVPCGSNGEAPYLSREERKKVIETVIDEVKGKTIVIAGTGSISTRETILFTKDAENLGIDAALVVTPFYYKLSNREIYMHYKAILKDVAIPIILYSVPKFTGIHLEPALISRLVSEHKNVIGVKDSSGKIDMASTLTRLLGDKISVLAGTADVALSTMMLGGRGAVLAVANVIPEMCSRLYETFKKGDYEEASRIQQQISYCNDVLVKKHNQLSAIKEAMNLRDLPAGYPRRPALPLRRKEKKEIENMLNTLEI